MPSARSCPLAWLPALALLWHATHAYADADAMQAVSRPAGVAVLGDPVVRPVRQFAVLPSGPDAVRPLLAYDLTGDGKDDVLVDYGNFAVVWSHTPQGVRQVSTQYLPSAPTTALPPGWPGAARLAGVPYSFGSQSDLELFAVAPLRHVATVHLAGLLDQFAIGDIDGDGALEVVGSGNRTSSPPLVAYDAQSGALEWSIPNAGGFTAVAQLDGDPALEVIVSGTPGRVYDGATRAIDFEYAPGFNKFWEPIATGNLDADAAGEFVAITPTGVAVFDSNPIAFARGIANPETTNRIKIADVDRDGIGEVLVADAQFGELSVHRASDGAVLSEVANPAPGDITGFIAADMDGAGRAEYLMAGDGTTSSADDYLAVGRLDAVPVQFDLDREPVSQARLVGVRDVDDDGADEYVVWNGYNVHVIDRATGVLEFRGNASAAYGTPDSGVAIGQLDTDAALELVVGNGLTYAVVDGATRLVERPSGSLSAIGVFQIRAIRSADIDRDGDDDIVLNNASEFVALEGRTGALLWRSANVPGAWSGFEVGNADADPALEVLVATDAQSCAYDGDTHLPQWTNIGAARWLTRAVGGAVPAAMSGDQFTASLVDAGTGAPLGPQVFSSGMRNGWWQRGSDGLDTVLLVTDVGLEVRDGATGSLLASSPPLGASAARDGGLVVIPDPVAPYRLRVVVGSYMGVQEFEVDTRRGLLLDGFE